MIDKNTNKKKDKISDDEILKALRKAVIDSIGDESSEKKAIEKMVKTDDLSNELRTIGRKLVRKQKTKPSGALVLTTKDIEQIKAVTDEKVKQVRTKKVIPVISKVIEPKKISKKVVSRADKTKLKNDEKNSVEKISSSTGLKDIESVQKLLPKPTVFDRISIIFSKKRLFILILIIIVLLVAGIPLLIYKSNSNNSFFTAISIRANSAVARVNGEKIGYKIFLEDVDALNNFFLDSANTTSFDISNLGEAPNDSQIRALVLERHTRVLLIRQALSNFGESVTDQEVRTQIDEVIRETGGREELEKIVNNLYGWTVDDFIGKALRPLLEEERLAIYVSLSDDLNKSKREEIVKISEMIESGAYFEEIARKFSEDATAENGGDLDWFAQGTMVPAFEEQVIKLSIDEVSEPFKTNFGWHIIKLTGQENIEGDDPRFRASHILIDYLTLNEYVSALRSEADIEIFIAL